MDEPLSNLDAKLRLEMRAEIRRIHNTLGATTIYVTHDQEEALSLADRIVVLQRRRVRQVGTPDDLYARPQPGRRRIHGLPQPAPGRGCPVTAASQPSPSRATLRSTGRVREDLKPGDPPSSRCGPRTWSRRTTGGLVATVVSSEFRGREFVAFGDAADGSELTFRAHEPLQPDATAHLRADPERALVFRGDAA